MPMYRVRFGIETKISAESADMAIRETRERYLNNLNAYDYQGQRIQIKPFFAEASEIVETVDNALASEKKVIP